jgi:hypothetical protein
VVCELSLKCRAVTERLPVARTDQPSADFSEPPSSHAVISALRFSTGPRYPARVESAEMQTQDEFGNTENGFGLQVCINRSIIVDDKPQETDMGPKEQDLFWNRI